MPKVKPRTGFPKTTGLWRIDAKVARQLLETEPGTQRLPTKQRVDAYARDVINHRWSVNGETLKVSDEGAMIDGQNRCLAIIEADKIRPGSFIDTYVICDLDEKAAFMDIDTGKARSLFDVLKLLELRWAWRTAGLLRLITCYEVAENPPNTHVSTRECVETLNTYDIAPDVAADCGNHYGKFQSSATGAFILMTGHLTAEQELAEEFLSKLITGENLKRNNAALTFRNMILEWRRYSKKLNWNDVLPYAIKAWNAYRIGQDLPALSYTGHRNEGFPRLDNDPYRHLWVPGNSKSAVKKNRPKLAVVGGKAA